MKTNQLKIQSSFLLCLGILLALLASVTIASAQGRNRNGNNGGGQGGFGNAGGFGGGFGNAGGGRNIGGVGSSTIPPATNYTAFSGFIAVRNIFNPNRFAVIGGTRIQTAQVSTRVRTPQVPQFSLVGTMAYEKGMFAFFDGSNNNLRKVLYQSDGKNIAGFTVEEITPQDVKLVSADKLQVLRMKVGDVMRQTTDGWELAGQVQVSDNFGGGGFAGGGFADTGSSVPGGDTSATDSTPDSSSTSSPALEGNSVLQRLMKLRQQQLGN